MAIPVIYKGDDTDFRGSAEFTLKVVTSANLNLSGCTVEVDILGFRKSFPASATGELVCPFAFSAAETQRMPLGIHAATVRVYDPKGRVRTINNSIRVKVTNSVHEAYGKDDPQEVTLAVATVDLEAYAKKEEVTAAITEALKDAGASVKLHVLTPEVTDTTVTLAPIDGAANYVAEGVGDVGAPIVNVEHRYIRNIGLTLGFSSADDKFFSDGCYLSGDMEYRLVRKYRFEDWYFFDIETVNTARFEFDDDGLFSFAGEIPAGSRFTLSSHLDFSEEINNRIEIREGFNFVGWADALQIDLSTHSTLSNGEWELLESTEHSFECENTGTEKPPKSIILRLPPSTDHARCFSLAVETDVETEKAVDWQGGEVIEALPGASKLAPGLNVWDVVEVAPGKFKVERASMPAQSAPLTLTAPNGRVAELVVGDDLVLEVKEK